MYLRLLAVCLPPLLVAAAAASHPGRLTADDAEHWQHVHTWLIPVLPLLALGPVLVAAAVDRRLAVVVAVPAYAYATFYTALDVLAGVGGGALVRSGERAGPVFGPAQDFEEIGGIALVVAAVLGVVVALRAAGPLALVPGAAAVAGAVLLWQEHLYRPWGVVAQLLLAVGWGTLLVLVRRRRSRAAASAGSRTSSRPGP